MSKTRKKPERVSDAIVRNILDDLKSEVGELSSPEITGDVVKSTPLYPTGQSKNKLYRSDDADTDERELSQSGDEGSFQPPEGIDSQVHNLLKVENKDLKGKIKFRDPPKESDTELVRLEKYEQVLRDAEAEERALGTFKEPAEESSESASSKRKHQRLNKTMIEPDRASEPTLVGSASVPETSLIASDTVPMAPQEQERGEILVAPGHARILAKPSASPAVAISEVQMLQAESLRAVQARILELEKEVEHLRKENELLASAGEIAKARADEYLERLGALERSRIEELDQLRIEKNVYRENLSEKERELAKQKRHIEELDGRLAKDFKKIRVRERELENRLELSKMEKVALLRAKDDALLELKANVDHLTMELESYKMKCADLNKQVDAQTDQLSRTVRALRLALTNLEANQPVATMLTPYKKAE